MPLASSELEAILASALASGDGALAVATLAELAQLHLDLGHGPAALRCLRTAAEHAAPLGEGALGRALGDLGVALGALGQPALADQTLESALAHVVRAGDLEGCARVALQRARSLVDAPLEAVEAAWAEAARRCALAGREADELDARVAAARTASERGDHARALRWLADLAPRLDTAMDPDAIWARGELGALWLGIGRVAEALPLLARAAREEAAAGRRDAATTRLHQMGLCLAMLGQPT
ncbi:MAG: hypothetical protein IPQ07_12410 [Myxococcales bacterium]|nr:hypothetical protein [Myxococcales bacterium]